MAAAENLRNGVRETAVAFRELADRLERIADRTQASRIAGEVQHELLTTLTNNPVLKITTWSGEYAAFLELALGVTDE